MRFVSYAKNNEDVMLWRVLKHVENGFYIDVGANDAVMGSVTKAFYDRGWRGINIEPLPVHCDGLRERRPGDVTLCCAAGDAIGEIEIYDGDVHGWATGEKTVAERHAREGHRGLWRRVPVRTLADICHEHVAGPIHFLKIDVDGMAPQVIKGADFKRYRPWIVLVEAALGQEADEVQALWEEPLLSQGYRFAYSDGSNRFYVAEEHRDFLDSVRYPPNVADGFIPAAQAVSEQRARYWETRARQLEEKARREEHKVRALAQGQLGFFHSASWRVTVPMRAVSDRMKRLWSGREGCLPPVLAILSKRGVLFPLTVPRRFVAGHPRLKAFLTLALSPFPTLANRLKHAGMKHAGTASNPSVAHGPSKKPKRFPAQYAAAMSGWKESSGGVEANRSDRRIIIDLQDLQALIKHGQDSPPLKPLAGALMAPCAGRELFILLDGRLQGAIEPIRSAFEGLLPQENIRLWHAPASLEFQSLDAGRQVEVAGLVRKAFLAGLHPDMVCRPSPTSLARWRDEGLADGGVELQAEQWPAASAISPGAAPGRRPKLAYVSPLPPEKSGVSDYSALLLPELAKFYDIDIVVSQTAVSSPWVTANCAVLSVEEFIEKRDRYQRVLYHVGNSRYHRHMIDLLARVPGVVVLHDFYLGHLQLAKESDGRSSHALAAALYRSHGYGAVAERFALPHLDEVVAQYPANVEVLQNALGLIAHSRYCRRMAEEWYGKAFSDRIKVIPHPRDAGLEVDRDEARRRLGLDPKQFVVCSFGFIGPFKLNHRLLEAWLRSMLARDPQCILVFVGENIGGEYGARMLKTIDASGLKPRIRVTGWAEAAIFKDYLASADLAVQLRTCSRGETSGAALYCMSAGIATIVNANGALAELPADAVWMLPDAFRTEQLVEALETLRRDAPKRMELGARARTAVAVGHNPQHCAALYAETLEGFYAQPENEMRGLIGGMAPALGRAISRVLPKRRPHRVLYLDLSATARRDLRTGIERVARALTEALLETAPQGFRVEPVYLSRDGGAWHYRCARRYTLELMGCPADALDDAPAYPAPGDIVLGLDISGDMLADAEEAGFFRQLRNDGVLVYVLVHDLLPIRLPECFPPGADVRHERWLKAVAAMDGAVCVSQTVADDLAQFCQSNPAGTRRRPFRLLVSHHGADIGRSFPTHGLPQNASRILLHCQARPTFIMVGTVEPRKGHLMVLEAFSGLWRAGIDVNLVIVGKEGWADLPDGMRRDIPQIVSALRRHPEQGRRLFWLEGISDEFLEKLYGAATCLIAASLDEGFGLPLIEAAQHRLPIFARDIPVFREVAGPHAFYFRASNPAALAASLRRWLWLYDRGQHPFADGMPWRTWRESARHLLQQLGLSAGGPSAGEVPPETGAAVMPGTMADRKIYVDISVVYREDWHTGIQRVVRALMMALPAVLPPGWAMVPVAADCRDGSWAYRDASDYLAAVAGEPSGSAGDASGRIVNPIVGDIFLGLDLAGSYVVQAGRQNYYARLRENWVKVYFVVYDLLPLTHPECFSPEDGDGHRQWLETVTQGDGVLCISRSVAAAVKRWLRENERFSRPDFTVDWFHLGADVENSLPTTGISDHALRALDRMARRPSFLMVGTLEPRKGCDQVLGAFERLWAQGQDVNLVIVGKRGWGVDALVETIRSHPELDERLFWLQAVSDEGLERIYTAAACLIAASADEGFGLPLIEAARYRLPIIARDIPVFREVAGAHAHYFGAQCDSRGLALAILDWLALFSEGRHPGPDGMVWLTWRESARRLVGIMLGDDR